MTQKLKELYSNLGLPESILNSVAGAAVIGLGEDADDAAITARANEKGIADMLKAYQSHADKVRTDAKKANIPIVAMTANAFDEDKRVALDAGMDSFVPKPFEISDLLNVLSQMIDKRNSI